MSLEGVGISSYSQPTEIASVNLQGISNYFSLDSLLSVTICHNQQNTKVKADKRVGRIGVSHPAHMQHCQYYISIYSSTLKLVLLLTTCNGELFISVWWWGLLGCVFDCIFIVRQQILGLRKTRKVSHAACA